MKHHRRVYYRCVCGGAGVNRPAPQSHSSTAHTITQYGILAATTSACCWFLYLPQSRQSVEDVSCKTACCHVSSSLIHWFTVSWLSHAQTDSVSHLFITAPKCTKSTISIVRERSRVVKHPGNKTHSDCGVGRWKFSDGHSRLSGMSRSPISLILKDKNKATLTDLLH